MQRTLKQISDKRLKLRNFQEVIYTSHLRYKQTYKSQLGTLSF